MVINASVNFTVLLVNVLIIHLLLFSSADSCDKWAD